MKHCSPRSEDGLTLIELMVTLAVLAITLTAFGQVIISSLQQDAESRQRQAASQLATEVIENLRDQPASQAAHNIDPANPASFTMTTAAIPGSCDASGVVGFDPGSGCEPLLAADGGTVLNAPPYVVTTPGNSNLTVMTYVSAPAGLPDGTRRVTVVVTSNAPSPVATYSRTSIFSEADRG